MNAARLREAATLLRERAEAATPGPWIADHADAIVSTSTDRFPYVGSPPVALALADWLDAAASKAEDVESSGLTFGGVEGRPALAVADAILGGDRA